MEIKIRQTTYSFYSERPVMSLGRQRSGVIRVSPRGGESKQTSLRSIFRISVLLGLMPCSHKRSTNARLIFYSATLQFAYRLLNFFIVHVTEFSNSEEPIVHKLIALMLVLVKASAPVIQILTVTLKKNDFLRLEVLVVHPLRDHYRIISLVGILVFPILLLLRINENPTPVEVLSVFCGIVDSITVTLVSMQYCTLLDLATQTFDTLDRSVRETKRKKFLNEKSREEDLCLTIDHHCRTIDSCQTIHELYSKQLFSIIVYLAYDFMVALYYTIGAVYDKRSTLWSICTVMYSFMCLSIVYAICNASERAKSKFSPKVLSYWILLYSTMMISYSLYCQADGWSQADFPVIIVLQTMQLVILYAVVISHAISLMMYPKSWKALAALSIHKRKTGVKILYYPSVVTIVGTIFIITLVLNRPVFNSRVHQRAYRIIFTIFLASSFLTSMIFCSIVEFLSRKLSRTVSILAPDHRNVEQCLKRHFAVCSFTHLICRVEGWPNMLLTLSILLAIITNVYMAQMAMRLGWIYNGVWYTVYSLFALFHLICMCNVCHSFTTKAEKFNAELFRLMRENKEMCKNEKLHLYVTMKHTVNFTACGFFTLGYPLVTSIIAAATTYLVILIQFSMPEKQGNN